MQEDRSLSDAFLEDHQHLTRGLSAALEALESDDLQAAVEIAEELDQRAGPHIRFEEEHFYPKVAERRGQAYVAQLFREHEAGRVALRALLAGGHARELSSDEKRRIQKGLREALDHAVSCGTLLSHVTTLEQGEQQRLLKTLLQLRETGGRWTDTARSETRAPE